MTSYSKRLGVLAVVILMLFSAFAIVGFVSQPASAATILTVSISSSVNPADNGQSITFTGSASFPQGDGYYNFEYKVNGGSGGLISMQNTTSPTWTTSFNPATYIIKVVAYEPSNQGTGSAEMNETVVASPSVSITASKGTIDHGMSVTFTATVSGGVSPYTFQWYLNGSAVSGATSSTWTTSTLPTGSPTVYMHITDSNGVSANSNTITMTVNPPLEVSISSSKNPIDVGMSVTFNSNVSGGTPPYTYQWSVNGANVSGATSSSYTTQTLPVGTDIIKLYVTDSVGDPALGVPTSSIPDVVVSGYPASTVYVGYTFSLQVVRIGQMFLWNGNFSDYSYQWFVNGRVIPGATNRSYGTYENTPGQYVFTVKITANSNQVGIYRGAWYGNFTENVTSKISPHSVLFVETGLPVGSVWSAEFIVLNDSAVYPYGTTWTSNDSLISTVDGLVATVHGNTSALVINPPNGTWTFYIHDYELPFPTYTSPGLFAYGNYTPNISEGNVTLPGNAPNGSVMIHIVFTLKSDPPSSNTSTSTSNSTTTTHNVAISNWKLNNSTSVTLPTTDPQQGDAFAFLSFIFGPATASSMIKSIDQKSANFLLVLVVSLAAIALGIAALLIQRSNRKRRNRTEVQD